MTTLREYLEEVADTDLAPTVGSMRTTKARRAYEPKQRNTRRQPKAVVALSPRYERALHTGGFTK